MKHFALPRFWRYYRQLPKEIQALADKNHELLKRDPYHPSLHFKKVGRRKQLLSVRVGENYRALGVEKSEGIVWFWIGTHSDYDRILTQK
ncbi:type II toxin-antitoxin system RelE family toxin [Lusitaniella coriacea]|uniref:type II toxin-antitoxin system RelE family toxin n=1 Tax=Lusitaniella coriacea TaxID=1983105 RepID=UPI003CE76301